MVSPLSNGVNTQVMKMPSVPGLSAAGMPGGASGTLPLSAANNSSLPSLANFGLSGVGGGMGGLGISSDSMRMMAQLALMMVVMMQNVLALMQQLSPSSSQGQGGQTSGDGSGGNTATIPAPPVGNTPSTPGTKNSSGSSGSPGSSSGSGSPGAPSGQVESAPNGSAGNVINWAKGEAAKGISEKNNKAYIMQNYSRGRDQEWCADFVSTAFAKNGGSPFGHQASVKGIRAWGERNGKYFGKSRQAPQAGDVMIQQGNGVSHTGIVSGVVKDASGKVVGIETVEGNSSEAVKTRRYSLADGKITGFVRP